MNLLEFSSFLLFFFSICSLINSFLFLSSYLYIFYLLYRLFTNNNIKFDKFSQFSSTVPDNLWSVLQTILKNSDYEHKFYHLKEVMNTWTSSVNYPVLMLEQDYYYGIIKITLQNPDSMNQNIWIPLTYTTQIKPNFTNTLPKYWLRRELSLRQRIDEKGWIIANLQQTGKY